jgi:hypothetical protein
MGCCENNRADVQQSTIPEGNRPTLWSWTERALDPTQDYFMLRYGSAEEDYETWTVVARVGRPESGVFRVEILIDERNSHFEVAKNATIAELNFYLIQKGEKYPWRYMQYHCGTASNVYSSIHWEFHIGSSPDESGS